MAPVLSLTAYTTKPPRSIDAIDEAILMLAPLLGAQDLGQLSENLTQDEICELAYNLSSTALGLHHVQSASPKYKNRAKSKAKSSTGRIMKGYRSRSSSSSSSSSSCSSCFRHDDELQQDQQLEPDEPGEFLGGFLSEEEVEELSKLPMDTFNEIFGWE